MQKKYSVLLALGVLVSSLSSCSRSNYAFNTTAPAYLGSEKIKTQAPTTEAKLEYSAAETTIALPAPRRMPARAVNATVKHTTKVKASTPTVVDEVSVLNAETSTVASASYSHAERKAIRHQVKRAIASHNSTTAEGKSQLVAVLLCFFLGGLGIHDFYMGKVGKGILQIFLSILIVGFILVIIDFVRLLTGDLKPKDGDWAKKL